jgi:predicted nucleic acid-binding Zn ribbon protein
MRRKHSQTRLQPLGEILFAALKRKGLGARLEENALMKLWPKVVGPQIAAQTQPDSWRAGTLFVKATSSVWVQQLHFMKDDIRRKLNELAGSMVVREILFTVGHRPAPRNTPHHAFISGIVALHDRDRKMIAECTEKLADPELAKIVKRVMKAEISRRRLAEKKVR